MFKWTDKTLRVFNFILYFCFVITGAFLIRQDLWIEGILILMCLAIYMIFTKLDNIERKMKEEG